MTFILSPVVQIDHPHPKRPFFIIGLFVNFCNFLIFSKMFFFMIYFSWFFCWIYLFCFFLLLSEHLERFSGVLYAGFSCKLFWPTDRHLDSFIELLKATKNVATLSSRICEPSDICVFPCPWPSRCSTFEVAAPMPPSLACLACLASSLLLATAQTTDLQEITEDQLKDFKEGGVILDNTSV